MQLEPLTVIENEIYALLRDYLKKNNQFSIKSALPICFSALKSKYSQQEITEALTTLISKKYIIQGSRLSREEILTNRVRNEIFKYIQINPGAYNRLIRRDLNLGSHEFNWHIGMLDRFDFIKKLKFAQRYGYYENRSYLDHEYDLFLLQNEKVHDILQFLEKEDATVSQIASEIEMHYSTVRKYVVELFKRKILYEKQNSEKKITVYAVNHKLLIKIRKIINGQTFIEFAST
jgi:predicted transcriptional regulator